MGRLTSPIHRWRRIIKDKVFHIQHFVLFGCYFQFSPANQTEICACDYRVSSY